jgi:hypothetical protein
MSQDNLTSKQQDWAIFLPAISGFYASYIGKQRTGTYIDAERMPAAIADMEEFNWLNDQKSLFPYKWSLYSAGHANLDLSKPDPSEDMVRNRDPNTLILGDSGGFQIGKGRWEGNWNHTSGCAIAQKKREQVLNWLDNVSNYGMILDIPCWVIDNPAVSQRIGITTYQEAVDATKYNNEYFIQHRRGVSDGGAKFLNVMQGNGHAESDDWYNTMKVYCDPQKYPGRHFNGWALGGQNKTDVHLMLRRLVNMRWDGLLSQGYQDWLHVLGTSKLEWAVLLTVLQRAIREHVNPDFTISFDCASPFLATANGQFYHSLSLDNNKKWSYRMTKGIDDKKYAMDQRSWRDVALTDFPGMYRGGFDESPVSSRLKISDICTYAPGDLNKIGKEGRTSWDSFSYFLQMGHNVWSHIRAVQEANRQFDAGKYPSMMRRKQGDYVKFADLAQAIFAAPDRQSAMAIVNRYEDYWMEFSISGGGKSGRHVITNEHTVRSLFDISRDVPDDADVDPEQYVRDHLGEI